MTGQIFIFTAGNADARDHLHTTIENSIDLDRTLELFPSENHDEIQKIHQEHELYAWGAVPGIQNTGRWNKLEIGDWMLCTYDNTYHWVARVLAKYDNEKFARAIWGDNGNDKTWQYMYFLSKPQKIEVPVSEYKGVLNAQYQGFTRIGDERLANIISEYGSVDNFIKNSFIERKNVLSDEDTYAIVRSNEGTKWGDEEGAIYRFGSTVPNYTRLVEGTRVVVDSRIDGEVKLVGYGTLSKAVKSGEYQTARRTAANYEAKFTQWHPFESPRSIPSDISEKIRSLPGYNVQHAIRIINKDVFASLINNYDVVKPKDSQMNKLVTHCANYLSSKGFTFEREDIANLILSLRSKPFVILAGISGTGKSKIIQLIGDAIGASVVLIPVKPDWSDNTDLMGYEDFQQQFRPARLTRALIEAHENPDTPYFILLDEMNLARVEHYFSDFLSVMETRDWDENNKIITKNIYDSNNANVVPCDDKALIESYLRNGLTIPQNVYIFGTVNMDETTHPFSRKVLDRANTIEFNRIDLSYKLEIKSEGSISDFEVVKNDALVSPYLTLSDVYKNDPDFFNEVIEELKVINTILEKRGFHVGYRLRDEVCFYMYLNKKEKLLDRNVAMDYQFHQKLLPRIFGGEEVRDVLGDLRSHCEATTYRMSLSKINFMIQRLDHGFTSFWL